MLVVLVGPISNLVLCPRSLPHVTDACGSRNVHVKASVQ
jgi:hypothetical protein